MKLPVSAGAAELFVAAELATDFPRRLMRRASQASECGLEELPGPIMHPVQTGIFPWDVRSTVE